MVSQKVSKPVISIDLDDVLYPFSSHFLTFANSRLGTNKTMADMVTYRLDRVYGIPYEQVIDLIEDFMAQPCNRYLEPIVGSVEALTELKREYSLHIITARLDKYREQTQAWLDMFFPGIFSGVHYCNFYALSPEKSEKKTTKLSVCKKINACCLVDDNVFNILDVIKGGVDGILFGDYAWHQELNSQDTYWALNTKTWDEFMECHSTLLENK